MYESYRKLNKSILRVRVRFTRFAFRTKILSNARDMWPAALAALAAALSSSSSLSIALARGRTSATEVPKTQTPSSKTSKTSAPSSKQTGAESGSGKLPSGSSECPSWAVPSQLAATPAGIVPYRQIADPLVASTKDKKADVAFYGDSITQLLAMELKDELAPDLAKFGTTSINGIGGDTVEGVTWRACQGLPDARLFVILVGTNNIASTSPDEIGRRVARLAAFVRAKRPKSDVLALGIFWRVDEYDKVKSANATLRSEIAKLDAKTRYADWGSVLTASDLSDNVHPKADGWRKVLPRILELQKSLK